MSLAPFPPLQAKVQFFIAVFTWTVTFKCTCMHSAQASFWLPDFVIIHFSRGDFIVVYSLAASIRLQWRWLWYLGNLHRKRREASFECQWSSAWLDPVQVWPWRDGEFFSSIWPQRGRHWKWQHLLSFCKLILVCCWLAWECSGPCSNGGSLCVNSEGHGGIGRHPAFLLCSGWRWFRLWAMGLCCLNTRLLGS